MFRKVKRMFLIGLIGSLLITNLFAGTSSKNETVSDYQIVLDKISDNLILENGKIELDGNSVDSLSEIELVLIPEILEDLNFLYNEGNIYIDDYNELNVRDINELAEFVESTLETDIDSIENNIVPLYDPDEPASFPLQRYVSSNIQYLDDYYNEYVELMIKYPNLMIVPQLQTQIEFASKVAEGQEWDYKREIGWNNLRKVIINGTSYYITGEDIGNIHYGNVGRSVGFSTSTLCKAGGIVQVLTSHGASLKQFTYDSYYDDPTDQAAIKRGTSWYDNGYFE